MSSPIHPQRDLAGYGRNRPNPKWPGGANVAINFVINYEEGAEYGLLEGDDHAEAALSDLAPGPYAQGQRFLNIESLYEYGSRVGFWRILRHFEDRELPFTINAVGRALEMNPEGGEAIANAVSKGTADVQSHGWRWIDYAQVPEDIEREHVAKCVETIRNVTGERPIGWYTGRPSINTRRLAIEEGGFPYDSDAYNDDLPYWITDFGAPHLIVPYGLDTNDSRCARNQGFDHADDFYIYMRDVFDTLYEEGENGQASMMNVGLHCRLIGKPGRIAGLTKFLDYVIKHDKVWVAKRNDIARHWIETHPYSE
ncbi:MAG: allantoinase PuuE [Rhodospirillales bacterium]|nr:allantoinase PuuE [Rhodospirillales bacterium]